MRVLRLQRLSAQSVCVVNLAAGGGASLSCTLARRFVHPPPPDAPLTDGGRWSRGGGNWQRTETAGASQQEADDSRQEAFFSRRRRSSAFGSSASAFRGCCVGAAFEEAPLLLANDAPPPSVSPECAVPFPGGAAGSEADAASRRVWRLAVLKEHEVRLSFFLTPSDVAVAARWASVCAAPRAVVSLRPQLALRGGLSIKVRFVSVGSSPRQTDHETREREWPCVSTAKIGLWNGMLQALWTFGVGEASGAEREEGLVSYAVECSQQGSLRVTFKASVYGLSFSAPVQLLGALAETQRSAAVLRETLSAVQGVPAFSPLRSLEASLLSSPLAFALAGAALLSLPPTCLLFALHGARGEFSPNCREAEAPCVCAPDAAIAASGKGQCAAAPSDLRARVAQGAEAVRRRAGRLWGAVCQALLRSVRTGGLWSESLLFLRLCREAVFEGAEDGELGAGSRGAGPSPPFPATQLASEVLDSYSNRLQLALDEQRLLAKEANAVRQREALKGGLVILNAFYGNAGAVAEAKALLAAEESANDASAAGRTGRLSGLSSVGPQGPSGLVRGEGAVDVTVPLMARVKDARLEISAAPKGRLLGFAVPPGTDGAAERRVLFVR